MRTTTTERYTKGLEILKTVGGKNYDRPLNQLKDTAPELARLTVEFCYGEMMARTELDLPTRQLCTVAALAALANAQPQLRYHIAGAINVGATPVAVIEIILLSAVFAGFPAAINAVEAAKEVFRQQNITVDPAALTQEGSRYARGEAALNEISAGAGRAVTTSLQDIAPDLSRFVIEFSYGDVLSRNLIDHRTKELAVIAMLTALGNAQPQLKVHIQAAINVGVSETEIVEVIQQMAIYAGFPAALNAIFIAKALF